MNKAPWKDFSGADIYEGDIVGHPSGERGKVVFRHDEIGPADQWRVEYNDDPNVSRLCLQIGDKGQAVVVQSASPPTGNGTVK